MNKSTMPLVLGTAQLGMTYGINNQTGQPSHEQAIAIVQTAWEQGIIEFDTAQAYGESEVVLGKSIEQLDVSQHIQVISKLDPRINYHDAPTIKASVEGSLTRLGVGSLAGLMLHHEDLLDEWEQGLATHLIALVKQGKVRRIGASIATPAKAIQALQLKEIDFIQVPANSLDRRFEAAGVFSLARSMHKDVYIRSVLLQGLLVMNEAQLPASMNAAKPFVKRFGQIAQEQGLSRTALALGYVRSTWPEAHIIVGAETQQQVIENSKAKDVHLTPDVCRQIELELSPNDDKILNPALWGK